MRKIFYINRKKYRKLVGVYKKTIIFAPSNKKIVSNAEFWLYIFYLFLLLL